LLRTDTGHITPEQLAARIPTHMSLLEETFHSRVVVEMLGIPKVVPDATTKVLVRTTKGDRVAVIICSRPVAPELVARGTAAAESIRELLGKRLGAPIIAPIASGCAGALSFVILPYCRELSSWKIARVVQRMKLKRELLPWLRKATTVAAERIVSPEDESLSFTAMLEYIRSQQFTDAHIRDIINEALGRISSREWQPCHTFDHNDLWLGNVMLPVKSRWLPRSDSPFVLIDWGGANPNGYGIYDLMRLSLALKLKSAELRAELVAHSRALNCQLHDSRVHLLASFARLHQHLEFWPEAEFVKAFHKCWNTLNRALGVAE